jgi:hypothetical protein
MPRRSMEPTHPLSLGVMQLGHVAGRKPLRSSEVKNVWSCTSIPTSLNDGGGLINYNGDFTLNVY